MQKFSFLPTDLIKLGGAGGGDTRSISEKFVRNVGGSASVGRC